MAKRQLNRGFTLFELILVIAISGLVLSIMGYFYIGFIKNKLYETRQLSLFNDQVLAQEYLSRNIKNALPKTIKITNGQQCVEFIKILGAGLFLSSPAADRLLLRKVSLDDNAKNSYEQARYLSLLDKNGRIVKDFQPIFSMSENTVNLATQNNTIDSPAFLLLSDVNQFCLQDKKIRLYKDADRSKFSPVTGPVSSKQPFTISSSDERSLQLHVSLIFGSDDFSLNSNFVITINNEY